MRRAASVGGSAIRAATRTKGMMAPVSGAVSLAAPVGGWNARDALGNMPITDAVQLTNFFPATTECVLRHGYSQFATGFSGQVESLMDYEGAATSKLFAACGSKIYDITLGGAVGAAAVSGLTNARWQYTNIATSGGNFMLCVNGADKLRGYNGSAWWADGDGTHDITGLDTATVAQINLHKNRVWLIQNNSLNAYYLGTSSIAGAATAFPLQSVARLGGYLVAMGTWTVDAGYGVDDHAVFVTSKGEIIVYKGTDPSSANTWSLVGVWQLGSPVGRRCLYKYAGDLLIISQDGLLPLSGALQSSRVNPKVALTDKIQSAVSEAVTNYGDNFGWQVIYFAKANQLWLNVPVAAGSQEQYAMNSISKAWGQYQGWGANCWEIYGDQPYFGGNGFVGKAWDTYSDNGQNITGTALQSFSTFGKQSQYKRFTMLRPIFRASAAISLYAGINVDFNTSTSTAPLTFAPTTEGTWDVGTWDNSLFGGDLAILQRWIGVSGVGYYGAPLVKAASQGIDVRWVSTDIVMEVGQII